VGATKDDLLAEIVGERTRRNPKFPDLVEEAVERQSLVQAPALADALTPDEEQGLISALESLRAGKGVPHDEAREHLIVRTALNSDSSRSGGPVATRVQRLDQMDIRPMRDWLPHEHHQARRRQPHPHPTSVIAPPGPVGAT
jgi:hypothetical protein